MLGGVPRHPGVGMGREIRLDVFPVPWLGALGHSRFLKDGEVVMRKTANRACSAAPSVVVRHKPCLAVNRIPEWLDQ